MASHAGAIGIKLEDLERTVFELLYQRACEPDRNKRGGLPPRCDKEWFVNTFCGERAPTNIYMACIIDILYAPSLGYPRKA